MGRCHDVSHIRTYSPLRDREPPQHFVIDVREVTVPSRAVSHWHRDYPEVISRMPLSLHPAQQFRAHVVQSAEVEGLHAYGIVAADGPPVV